MPCFIDTNILLYAKSTLPLENQKRLIAEAILRRDDCVLSVQVLQEFYVQVVRPNRPHSMSREDAVALINIWRRFNIQPQTFELLLLAFQICGRPHFSYWDSAIIAAAMMTNCDILCTEDLQHGQKHKRNQSRQSVRRIASRPS
jgi:predicted nucleic acid-binding protein